MVEYEGGAEGAASRTRREETEDLTFENCRSSEGLANDAAGRKASECTGAVALHTDTAERRTPQSSCNMLELMLPEDAIEA